MIACTIATLWLFLMLTASTGATAPLTWQTGLLSGPVKGAPIENYGIIEPDLLSRSSKPSTDGYAWLRQQGVKSIVDFTEEDVDESFLKELGFTSYLRLPFDGPPSDVQAEQFLTFVEDSQHWPLHVHCYAGRSRTGVMVALLRYAIDGWPLKQALKEAKLYRSGKALSPDSIAWLKRWVKHHPPGSHQLVRDNVQRSE